MSHAKILFAALLVSTTVACTTGKELGRVALAGEGTSEVSINAPQAGSIQLWTDLSIDYEGDASLLYKIDVLQDGKPVATTTCNPLGHMPIKLSWTETNIGSKHHRKGSGKMECTLSLPKAGPSVVKATLAFAHKPASSTITKADIVVRQ